MGVTAFNSRFGEYVIRGDRLRRGFTKWPIAECEAFVDQGANVSARITATRVGVGTVIFPGVGTLVGARATKNRNKIYLVINVPGDVLLTEASSTKEADARRFAINVNRAAQYFASANVARVASVDHHPTGVSSASDLPAAGWYPFEHDQRYWDGTQWTGHVAPR